MVELFHLSKKVMVELFPANNSYTIIGIDTWCLFWLFSWPWNFSNDLYWLVIWAYYHLCKVGFKVASLMWTMRCHHDYKIENKFNLNTLIAFLLCGSPFESLTLWRPWESIDWNLSFFSSFFCYISFFHTIETIERLLNFLTPRCHVESMPPLVA